MKGRCPGRLQVEVGGREVANPVSSRQKSWRGRRGLFLPSCNSALAAATRRPADCCAAAPLPPASDCSSYYHTRVPGPENRRPKVAQDPPAGPHAGGPPLAGAGDGRLAGRGLRHAPRESGSTAPAARPPSLTPRRIGRIPPECAAPTSARLRRVHTGRT